MNVRDAIDLAAVTALQFRLSEDPAQANALIHWGPDNKNACHWLHYICDKVFDGTLDSASALPFVRALIAAGADVNFGGGDPIIAAVSLGAIEVAFVLLDAG